MKVLSKQIFLDLYSYLTQNTAKQWFCVKGRPDMTIEIVNTSIYNTDTDNMTKLFMLVKRKGVVHRIEYSATLTGLTVWRSDKSVYLAPGDEYGLEIIGDANNDIVQISVMGVVWSDKDILTARGMVK